MKTRLINFLKKSFIKDVYDKNDNIKRLFRFIDWIINQIAPNPLKPSYSINSYRDYHLSNNPQRLINLKNVHLGDVCFVIGNGPSLISSDLDKLKGYITFGSNYIFEMKGFLPTYYFAIDCLLLKNEEFLIKLHEIIPKTSYTFLPFNIIPNSQKKHLDNAVYFYLNPPNHILRKFSFDISQSVYDGWTVTYSILQCAIYMGFKKIYLLGIDNTESGHFYDSDNSDENAQISNKTMHKSYLYLKSVLPSDVKIVNCTRGGLLELFDRISLDKVIAELDKALSL